MYKTVLHAADDIVVGYTGMAGIRMRLHVSALRVVARVLAL